MTATEQDLVALPAGLRDRVLDASWQARAVGRPVHQVAPISPVEAFSRTADALYGTLCALPEQVWCRPVLRGLDVQCLIGHLIGVEHDLGLSLAGDPDVARADHAESTWPAAIAQAGRRFDQTRTDWRHAVDRTLEMLRIRADHLTDEVALHGMRLPLASLLIVRAFELWTHDDDIRRVAGLPLAEPEPSTLRLMTELAAGLLPHAVARMGQREPVSVHLVLTGPGGGTWDVAVGEDRRPVACAISIVADAVGFCRLVANRTGPADLDPLVIGDSRRIAGILAAASSLALD
ncbi:MAG TPA: maleylpyruvate isomerase family mycothiol-dependent enzyme [Streptosporangiaceae bacterium]|nr:maleylpyruvate isomerase family mycothiol-dependent enzyme [Streptosporangiaceae bacterium]